MHQGFFTVSDSILVVGWVSCEEICQGDKSVECVSIN